MPNTFRIRVITPEHTFFDDEAQMLIVEAADGSYGIMAGHEPVVLSMVEGLLRFQLKDGSWKEAAASSGFATVLPDEVTVMLQTAEWPEDIDKNRALEDARIANERLRQQKSMQEYHLARTMLARAMVRLRVTNRSTGGE